MNHTAPARNNRTATEDLQHVLDHWDHLRALLDTAGPGGTWPPQRPGAEYLRALDDEDAAEVSLAEAIAHQLWHPQRLVTRRGADGRPRYECMHCDYTGEGRTHPMREDRDPAQLGERPVPIRLHVADACRAIEIALCRLADSIATRDALDTADWHARDRAQRTAPNAARWLLARLGDGPSPCCPTHDADRARIADYAREAARRLDRVLGTGRTSATLPGKPCPWCGGDLIIHTEADAVMSVTCATGLIDCNAPVPFNVEQRARVWSTVEQLAALQKAIDAAEARCAEDERRAKRTEARRQQRAAAKARERATSAA